MKRTARLRPFDNHWRSNRDEYEFLSRIAFDNGLAIAEATREMIFISGWRRKLDELRKRQRSAKVPDSNFYHPMDRKEK